MTQFNKDIILSINEVLKQLNVKYVYCGDFSLYLNGIKEITEFEDVDIDFCDTPNEEKPSIPVFLILDKYLIDKLSPVEGIPLRYHEIDFEGEKMLISDLDYELEIDEYLLSNNLFRYPEGKAEKIQLIKKYLNVEA